MKRLFGLCLFSFGIGMAAFLLIPVTFWSVVFTFICIIAGYYLFCFC